MFNAAASVGAPASLFFYSIIVIGNWILLNLFIAILIQGFAEQKATALAENLQRMQERFLAALGGLNSDELAEKMAELFSTMDKDNSGVIDKRELQKMLESLEVRLSEKELTQLFRKYDSDGSGEIDFAEFLDLIKDLLQKAEEAVKNLNTDDNKNPPISSPVAQLEAAKPGGEPNAFDQAQALHAKEQQKKEAGAAGVPRSLFLFEENHPFRKFVGAVANNKVFDNFILACILASSICLAIENPDIGDNSPMRRGLVIVDLTLNSAFILEMLLKVFCFLFGK
jgi:hypothetical protein